MIMNFDETAVFFETNTKTTLEIKGKPTVGVFSSGKDKQRFTAICGFLSSGEALPLIIILKTSSDLRENTKVVLANLKLDQNTKALIKRHKVLILQNKKAWNNVEIMKNFLLPLYFKSSNRTEVLAIMDNFSGHTADEMLSLYKSVEMPYMFLPANCTSVLQPFDVSIAKAFKGKVRTKFLEFAQENLVEKPSKKGPNKITFTNPKREDIIKWAVESWVDLNREEFQKSKHY
jgi:hypothetical protein